MTSNRQECVVHGCNSNSIDDQNIRFFRFPPRGSTEFRVWMSTCKDSHDKIHSLQNPLVCSLHFAPEEIGQQRLHPNAFPRLNLPKEYYDAQDEIAKTVDYVGNVTREWVLRSQYYQNISHKTVYDVTRCVRECLNVPRHIPNPLWIRTFKYQPIFPDLKGNIQTAKPFKKSEVIETIRAITKSTQKELQPVNGVSNLPVVLNEAELDEDVSGELLTSETNLEDIIEIKEEKTTETKFDGMLNAKEKEVDRTIDSYEDALEYLKPLQYYATAGEEHRAAIGLLKQLQEIFSDPKQF